MQMLLEAGRGKEQSLPRSPRRSQPCSHLAFTPAKLSLDLRTPERWGNKCASLCTTRFVVTVTAATGNSCASYGRDQEDGMSASQRPEGRAVSQGASPCKGPGAASVCWRFRHGAGVPRGGGGFKTCPWDFPGGTVVENPPANAGDTGSRPGPGRSHMPRSN